MKGNAYPLVISGPSGSGKSTILNRLFKEFPKSFGFSVSHTTRGPRQNEVNGVQYHFVTSQQFDELISKNQFIEHVEYAGNKYGTSFGAVQDVIQKGLICVLDIEMQGVKLVTSRPDFKALYVFIRPPSLDALASRLKLRGTDTQEAIKKRLNVAESEIQFAETSGVYNKIILNDDIEKAYLEVKQFIQERYQLQE